MKKVLLIENRPDYGIGGIETYNRNLYKILTINFKNIKIDRAAFLPCENIYNGELLKQYYYVFNPHANYRTERGNYNFAKIAFLFHKFRNLIYKLNRENNYDLIIDSTITTFKKFNVLPFYFWVQHNTPNYYKMFYIKNKLVRNFIIFCEICFGVQNNILHANNLILYDWYNYEEVRSKRTSLFNAYIIPLSSCIPSNFTSALTNFASSRKRILYFGRIDNEQKNINLLSQINNKLNLIDFYGKGDANWIKKLGSSYKGFINNDCDGVKNLFTKYKFMIVMSNYEGFSYSLTQALSYGLPIIVLDTYASAKFLVNDNQNGFLLQPGKSLNEYVKQLKNIYSISNEQYLQLSLNAYKFAQDNLSEKQFQEKWLRIFNKFLN